MTDDPIAFDRFRARQRTLINVFNLAALDTSNMVMMVVTRAAEAVMLFAVKLLDARQDAAFRQTL